jgi:LemA protein
MEWILVVVVVVVGAAGVWAVLTYNGLVHKRNRVDNAWGQIDVQLKRRRDLVPNLVSSVQGYAAHERATLDSVVQARAAATHASTPAESGRAESGLTDALGRLFALAESYPQLQASQGFRDLQAELAETEDRIAVSRQVYNDTVLTYQNAIQVVPTVLIAKPLGFTDREYFEMSEPARAVPEVRFDPPPPALDA